MKGEEESKGNKQNQDMSFKNTILPQWCEPYMSWTWANDNSNSNNEMEKEI